MSELDNQLLDPETFEVDDAPVRDSVMAEQRTNEDGERLYYWVEPSELGDVSRSTPESELMKDTGGYYTEAEIRAAWDAEEGMGYLKEQTDWDNYWGYLTERQDLIDAGELSDGDSVGAAGREARQELIQGAGGLKASGGAKGAGAGTRQANSDARTEQFTSMINDPAQVALMEKYGISNDFQNDDGDVFQWNGSSYTKTVKVDGPDYGMMIIGAGLAAATSGVLGPAISGAVGKGALATGLTAASSSAITQAALTGDIDARSAITSGLMAGLNPGGLLTDKLGMNPDSFGAGVVGGAVDSATGGLLSGDGADLGDALVAGLGRGAMNSLKDFFKDMSDRSIEQRMKQAQLQYPNASDDELYEIAMSMQGTGTSDLGGLIGKDGLIPGIDEVGTTWVNGLMGGGDFRPGGHFLDADGNKLSDTELLAMGIDPKEVGLASLNGGNVDGYTYVTTTQENTWLGDLWDATKEHVPGIQAAADFVNNGLDAAAKQQFIDKYGFDPDEHPDAARQVFIYGAVDETYTFSDDPRGDAEVIGQIYGKDDEYSTGTEYVTTDGVDHAKVIDAIQNEYARGNTDPTSILSMLTDGGFDTSTVMPGSDISYGDAILQGILDGAGEVLGGGDDEPADLNNEVQPPTLDIGGEIPFDPVLPDEGGFVEVPQLPPKLEVGGEVPFNPQLPIEEPPPEIPPATVEPPPVLPPAVPPPPTGGGGGGGGGGAKGAGGLFDNEWGELYGYSTVDVYKAPKGLEPMTKELRGMLS